jgi:signal transduction histidine kinase
VIDVLAQAMRLGVGSAAGLSVAAALVGRAAMRSARIAACLIIGTAALAVMASPPAAAQQETRILILNATDPYLPAFQMIDAAMREALAKHPTRHFVYFSETLDAQRFDWKQYETAFLALLVKKYKGLRIDVVVAVSQVALDFVNDHGKELWPGAEIVFHAVHARALENAVLPAHVTGVVPREDHGGTLDLARRLQPDARRILIIAGVAEQDQYVVDETREALSTRALPIEIEIEFLLGLPQSELVERLKRETANTIVLYLTEFRDRDGRPYTPPELLRTISAISPAPIYGSSEAFLTHHSVVAGVMESYADRGRFIAGLVLQMLAGASPAPAIAVVPNRCIADAKALHRWSLDEGRLPEGCEIRFAERPFWREYPWQTFGVLALVLFEGALITVLLVERHRRYAAELNLLRRLLEVEHLNRVVSAGVLSASVAHELTQPLGAIQSYAEAAEVYLKAGPDNVGRVETILASIRRDDERAMDIIRRLRGLLKKRTEIELQDFDLNDALRTAVDIIVPEATKRGVELSVNTSPVALPVRADPIQLQQVVLNLAMNGMDAMQSCASDKRKIGIQTLFAGKSNVEVAISDSGTGIADGKLAEVFEPFYTTKPQGTGLGLSISRAIIETFGGKLWAESRPEGGATFRFTLPMARAGVS